MNRKQQLWGHLIAMVTGVEGIVPIGVQFNLTPEALLIRDEERKCFRDILTLNGFRDPGPNAGWYSDHRWSFHNPKDITAGVRAALQVRAEFLESIENV